MNPYHQINISESLFVREFNPADTEMFIWHRDKKDRIVKIISSKGWMLQIDNEIPIILETGKNYLINKNVWHRIIAGKEKLVIEIFEIKDGGLK